MFQTEDTQKQKRNPAWNPILRDSSLVYPFQFSGVNDPQGHFIDWIEANKPEVQTENGIPYEHYEDWFENEFQK